MSRILAVDDSPSMRRIMDQILRSAGYEVILAADGDEALEFARRECVNLVLSDVYMARMDGISLVQQLRTLEAYRLIPVFLLTTESSPEKKQEGKAAGANGWILKPFGPERLLSLVAKILN